LASLVIPPTANAAPPEPVRLGPSTGDLVLLLLLAPVVGMAAGLALPWVAVWVENLPWAPFQGPLELVASMTWERATVAGCGAGLMLGVASPWSRSATRRM